MIKYIIYTTVPSLLILITVIWLIVALIRKSSSRKLVGSIFAAEVVILLGLYFYYLSPREYPRNYVTQPSAATQTLGEVASRNDFFIGAAINKSVNPAYPKLVPKEFNSITPENATKWRQMLVNGKIGEYDFTEADAIVNHAVEKGVRVRGIRWCGASFQAGPIQRSSTLASRTRRTQRQNSDRSCGITSRRC
jgi:hypothetical protein